MISLNPNNPNNGPEVFYPRDAINIEFIFLEPRSVEIKYRSKTAPPTLPMVKTFDSDLDWQVETSTTWSAPSAFKKFLAELKPQTETLK